VASSSANVRLLTPLTNGQKIYIFILKGRYLRLVLIRLDSLSIITEDVH
jgi:hypothetical protein